MYDFDKIVDRTGTDSTKYYFQPETNYDEILEMGIADMDFETAPAVKEAVMARAAHGIYGYTVYRSDYYAAVTGWLKNRHGLSIDSKWITTAPGVVAAIKNACAAFTNPGDTVLIQEPVYHFFRAAPEANGCKVVSSDLVLENGEYHIDLDDFEKKIIENDVKVFILCNPHNPTGNLWSTDELYRMGMICKEHHVLVIADEIHNDFVFPGQVQTPFLSVDPSFQDFTIFCTAPSKTFNLAGIKVSNIIIPNEDLRKTFDRVKAAHGLTGSNALAGKAVIAAYTKGAEWVDELVCYIQENFRMFDSFLKERLPMLHLINHQSLYLAWVDFRAFGMVSDALKEFVVKECGIFPNMGEEFGSSGAGFVRFNLACPRSVVQEALTRLEKGAKARGLI